MKWLVAWVEEYEGEKGIIQESETDAIKVIALVASLLTDPAVSQVTILVEDENGRVEA